MTLDNPTNETNIITRIEEELPKSTLYWFFISLAATIVWTIYITYYNSRVIGLIVTFIANKFVKYGRINVGSFSVSVLSGKIMFRAVHYITEDFSVRIEYGWIIFKWWRPYVYKDIREDMSHSETRLYSFIDGFEFHVYNRSGTYESLEKLFGHRDNDTDSCEIQEEPSGGETDTKKNGVMNKTGIQWRDLIPVCKFDITTCRFVFGNNLVPNTLIVHLDDSHITYTTTPASTVFDEFMHDLKVKSDSLRIILVPSDNYTGGIVDEPPRMMGEGFVVMQSTDVKLHYYMDQPGTVPYEPEIVALADGETVVRQTYPTMGLDIQCGKNTDFNYGPWADRQREYLWKFFYPSSYQPLVPSKVPASGETRQYRTFEFRMNIVAQATIDILFTKYSITQAVHMSMGQGSYVESSIPWVTEETGYTSLIKGQLLLLEATTSMQFRSLLECETLDFSVTAAYPLEWNAHQDWKYSFTACKATAFLIFQHKHFFTDLIDDWSSKSVPDVYHYVPYTYSINLIINQFELVTLCNEYNWIDTSSQHQENAHIAFCGDMFDLSIQLPYTDFLPLTNSIGFIFKVENVFCRLYLPENNTSRHVMIAMSKNMKIVDRDGNILEKPFCYDIDDNRQWRRLTQRDAGWIDCWQTSNVALSITYKYHPMPPFLKSDTHHVMSADDSLITTKDPEEALLIPLRPMRPASTTSSKVPDDFDAGEMDSDLISVELEVAPSVVCVYGSLLRNFLHVKENYLGEDQNYTDFYDQPKGCSAEPKFTVGVEGPLTEKEVVEREFDARKYRPFAVTVSVTLHDIQGHLVKNCNLEDVPCPSVYVERLGFEMDKNYAETKLQVLISPAVLIAKDNVERETDQAHLKEGHIGLSGLQVRGHAMFSHKDLALESETLEYAWLVEAIIGDITGKLTSPQIQNIVESLQTFVMLVEDPENSLQRPLTYQLCQHMTPQPLCKKLQPQYMIPCPSSEDIKYRMTRASVDCVNIFVVESGTSMNIQIYPIRLSTCNLHGNNTRSGINCLIEHISLKQFISTAPIRHDSAPSQPEIWLESGGFSLGPINAEAAMALPNQDFHSIQDDFLKLHDLKTNRLWFLWPGDGVKVSTSVMGKCGCLGGCVFFGNNRNGVAFFHPKKFRDVTPTAICKVSPEGMDPGFGQSLLHKNKLVFDIGDSGWLSPTREFAFTRGYMSSVTTPDTPVTSITVVEEISSSPRHLPVETVGESVGDIRTQKIFPRSPTSETVSSSSVVTTSPSEVLSRESIGTNPFDTVRSVDSGTRRESGRGSIVDGHGSSVGNLSLSSSQSPPPFSPTSRSAIVRSPSSRSSGQSPSGRSSATSQSPSLLRRLRYSSSHHSTSRQVSTVSLESEMYFSAEEDAYSSSDIAIPSEKTAASQEMHSSGSDSVNLGTMKPDTSMKLDLHPSPFSTREKTVIERQDSSSSLSNSTLSYMSADTDPDETLSQGLLEEELSMVDLHGQVNKPITQSPVLLPCYSGHLTRLQCSNWSTQSPFPARYHGITVDPSSYQSLHSAGQSGRSLSSVFVPHYVKTKQGFSTRIMRAKEAMFAAMEKETLSPPMDDSTISDTVEGPVYENTSRTTATVKLKGSLDVLVTPLLLESLQRFCEAVTPALTNLHPSAILDNLHFRCLDQLKSQNRLKKAEDNTDPDTPDSPDSDEGLPGFVTTQRQFSGENRPCKTVEVKTSSYQALLTLSRINICMLQAGMVEEKISFSALDNISELTCVSLVGISIDNVRCQLLSNSHSCKTTKDILPSMLTGSPAKSKLKDGKPDLTAEVEKDNVPEILREEDVGTLHLNSVHLQLRRLLRDGHISEDVILTAIPEHKSKVMFSFENDVTKLFSPKSPRTIKVRRSQSGRESVRTPSFARDMSHDVGHEDKKIAQASIEEENPFDAAPAPRLLRQRSKDSSEDPRRRISSRFDERHSIGYIMFECGLEDISISAVRRLGYKEKSDTKFHKRMEEVNQEAEDMEASTRAEVEGQGHSSDSQDQGQGQSSSQSQSRSRSQKTSDSSKPSITVGSQELYPSSNSVHSWDSRVSIPSDASILCDNEPLKGDASSGTLHLKTVWFNFAAPPPLPIKRKADFTKWISVLFNKTSNKVECHKGVPWAEGKKRYNRKDWGGS